MKPPFVFNFNAFTAELFPKLAWHPNQKMQDSEDGGLELKLCLPSPEEVEPWVLSWGSMQKSLLQRF
jgi:hypothetical protein